MLLFYVRHGDPIYSPDTLTPLGKRQAEAVGKRIALYGVDKIYASSSERAKLTAQPACEMLKMTPEILDWCNENYAWNELTYNIENFGRTWVFNENVLDGLMTSKELCDMGFEWYNHPKFKDYDYKYGIERIQTESRKFLSDLGYEFDEERNSYKHTKDVYDRIALFAHQGFGLTFLSCVLNIPYPIFTTHFDLSHSSMTVIDFTDVNGYAVPKILTLSNDSHLYREGLPTKYNNCIYF